MNGYEKDEQTLEVTYDDKLCGRRGGRGCCNPFLGPHKIYIKIYSQRRLEK
jgi:hypothetical protein